MVLNHHYLAVDHNRLETVIDASEESGEVVRHERHDGIAIEIIRSPGRTSILGSTEPKRDLRCVARWRCPHNLVMQPMADLLCIPSRVRAVERHYRLLGIHLHVDLSPLRSPKVRTLRRSCWRNSDSVAFTQSRHSGAGGRTLPAVAPDAAPRESVEGWRTVLAVLVGLSPAVLIMSSPPASATTKTDACAALTPVLASRLLGARVIQAPFNHHLGCTYTSTANQDTISLILSLTGQNRARTQQLLNQEQRLRVGSQTLYWYRTPLRLTRPEQAGTLSALKGSTLVLIAVRQSSNPQPTAREAMTAILPRI